jgi:hypothetical protein
MAQYRSTDQPINRSTDQPINRSTDQPINRSTDQPINRSVSSKRLVNGTMPMFLILLLSGVTGCRETTDTVSDVAGSSKLALMPRAGLADASLSQQAGSDSDSPPIIDAGIIFSDRSNYLCIPIERLGLDPSEEIVSVRASCDCVTVEVVEYAGSLSRFDKAIFVTFLPELEHGQSMDVGSVSLGVIIDLRTAGSEQSSFVLNFLRVL